MQLWGLSELGDLYMTTTRSVRGPTRHGSTIVAAGAVSEDLPDQTEAMLQFPVLFTIIIYSVFSSICTKPTGRSKFKCNQN